MQDNPIYSILIFFVGAFFFKMWLDDAISAKKNLRAFPGASFTSLPILVIGSLGAIFILFCEIFLEIHLNFTEEQSRVKFWALFVWISASITEEIVFRGYIVIENRGKIILYISIFIASLLFTLFHPFFWDYTSENGFQINITDKAIFSSFFIFINSIWFYFLRFNNRNKTQSLLPCMVAHAVYNIGVFVVKAFQGFVVWNF